MKLNNKAIKEFQEIYKKEFHEEIDEATARERAERLLNLFRVVYKPRLENKNYEREISSKNQ